VNPEQGASITSHPIPQGLGGMSRRKNPSRIRIKKEWSIQLALDGPFFGYCSLPVLFLV